MTEFRSTADVVPCDCEGLKCVKVVIGGEGKIQYACTEHPTILYHNKKYFKFMNLTSQRYGRSDPFYYLGLHLETAVTMSNNVTVDFYFYELLTNVYKRNFIEMHHKLCDLVEMDKIFGAPLKQGKLARPCPYPPDTYNMYNMTANVSVIPFSFPFRKGRIYANITLTKTKELIASGFVNIEIKTMTIKD